MPVAAQTTCDPGTAEAFLDVGNVRAKILNNGALFWNGSDNAYEVPKGGGVHSIFSASLWIGGMVDDELRVAATMYGPWEFWPGPLASTAPSPDLCAEYDRIWEVGIDDLQESSETELRVQTWPVAAGAPFIDVDGDGAYRPSEGDRPEMLGDQQFWWVMNDASGPHRSSNSDSLGVEVRATAFAFDAPGVVGNSTLYKYRIRNASADTIRQTYASLFADVDVGAAFDDYVGSDTTLGLGYFYNADNDDGDDRGGYRTAPPAIGFIVLKRPDSGFADGSTCGYPDEKSLGFTNFIKYVSYNPVGGGIHPTPLVFYNYMQSRWRNGEPLTWDGGQGRHPPIPMRFQYPGDPVIGGFWSALNVDNAGSAQQPTDERAVSSVGPFCMSPGEEVELVIAIVWSRGSSNLDSVRQLREDVAYIYYIRDVLLTPRALPTEKGPSVEPELPFAASVYPNPVGGAGGAAVGGGGGGSATVRFSTPELLDVSVTVFNALGQRVYVAAERGPVQAGDHSWTLPTETWPPGVYLVRITAGHTVTTRQLTVTSGT